ncbi:MAG: rhomboid family intramembrane serine protease [Fuerstiella sp.]
MGLENRDYLKDEKSRYSSGYSSGGAAQSVCKLLIMINIAVYVLQLFSNGLVEKWFVMDTPAVLSGQVWRLLTYGFLHGANDLLHILLNMLLLWWFGPRLESIYGSREFLTFYLISIVLAAIAYLSLDLVTGDPVSMLGASGGVMAVLTLYACHFPRQVIYVMFVIPVELRWAVGLYALFDLHPLIMELQGKGTVDNVAHAAHLGGMLFGYLYYKKGFRLDRFSQGLTSWWKVKRSGFKVVSAEDHAVTDRRVQKLEAEMDILLAKISKDGEASLSRSERKTLENVSRELRSRRQ